MNLSHKFYEDVKNNVYEKEGWPRSAYSMSKIFIHAYGRIMGKSSPYISRNIQIYSLCPGWVKTDMGGPKASLTVDQGIITPCFLFDLPCTISENQGKFYAESKVIDF